MSTFPYFIGCGAKIDTTNGNGNWGMPVTSQGWCVEQGSLSAAVEECVAVRHKAAFKATTQEIANPKITSKPVQYATIIQKYNKQFNLEGEKSSQQVNTEVGCCSWLY